MNKRMTATCLLTTLLLINVFSQAQEDKGIVWTTGMNWEQVKVKAKKENKYIFIDAFTTWCTPCKQMDKYVYPNDTVGDFFNDKFIAVRVQMDRVGNDNEAVRSWYDDADKLKKKYRITGYPTYVFLRPDGNTVYKTAGYMPPQGLIGAGARALAAKSIYKDEYAEYDSLVANYKKGLKNYDRMQLIIKSAKKLGDVALYKEVAADYIRHLKELPDDQLYRKDILLFLAEVELKSDSRFFRLFYPDGKKADAAMGKKLYASYASQMVDKVILREISLPFLKIDSVQKRPVTFKNGIPFIYNQPEDSTEADWNGLYKKIAEVYPTVFAERGVLNAKNIWYEQHNNYKSYYRSYLEKLDRDGFDTVTVGSKTSFLGVNSQSWFIFLSENDQEMLKGVSVWMKKVVSRYPKLYMFIDTYANVLYKKGDKLNAILWEEKAIKLAEVSNKKEYISLYSQTLEKMKRNEPTWNQ